MASIVRRGDMWSARVTRKGYPQQNKSFPSKAEAEAWAIKTEAAMLGRAFVDTKEAEDILVGDLIDNYLTSVLSNLGRKRSEYYRLRAVGKRLGKYSVANLSAEVLHDWMQSRLKDVKPATVEREVNQLHGVFTHAITVWKMRFKNPCLGLARPKFNNRRSRILSDNQLNLVFHELSAKHGGRNPLIADMAKLALETAMRRGELHGLLWEHVDLKRRVAFLPKTKNGDTREVPLSTKAVAILESVPRTTDLVFPGINYENFHGVWKRACERAGITDFHFHDLRHMAISRIAAVVPNVIDLSRISGHRNIKNLMRYYHTTPEQLAERLG